MCSASQVQANELSKETRLKEKLQEEVRTLLSDLEQRTADAANLSFQLAQANKNAHRGEAALREQRVSPRWLGWPTVNSAICAVRNHLLLSGCSWRTSGLRRKTSLWLPN